MAVKCVGEIRSTTETELRLFSKWSSGKRMCFYFEAKRKCFSCLLNLASHMVQNVAQSFCSQAWTQMRTSLTDASSLKKKKKERKKIICCASNRHGRLHVVGTEEQTEVYSEKRANGISPNVWAEQWRFDTIKPGYITDKRFTGWPRRCTKPVHLSQQQADRQMW